MTIEYIFGDIHEKIKDISDNTIIHVILIQVKGVNY